MAEHCSDSKRPLILIDGSSWLFRAFHALPPLSNKQGEPTGAVYGMGNMLRRLLKDYAPEEIGVIFDAPGTNFRHELYADYKANRDETPQDLKLQYPAIVEMIEGLGLPVIAEPDVEADRSEEHTSELQSLMRISYAVFCLKKKKTIP